jgi:hypothetical protein
LQLFLNAHDLLLSGFALLAIQFDRRSARQAPLRAAHDGGHHLQIAQQFSARREWHALLCLPLRLEK